MMENPREEIASLAQLRHQVDVASVPARTLAGKLVAGN